MPFIYKETAIGVGTAEVAIGLACVSLLRPVGRNEISQHLRLSLFPAAILLNKTRT
jgi:hypothetical protein